MRSLVVSFVCLVACSSSGVAPSSGSDAGTTEGDSAALDAAPAPPPSSGGKGGLDCTSTRTLGDRKVCVSSAGGSEFRVIEPVPGPGALRIAVYVHGDGARAYVNDGAMRALLPWADAHHALVVAVLAPNACAWWQKATQTDCSDAATPDPDGAGANADALKAVLDQVRSRHDVRLDASFFYGASGGSVFLSKSFLRRFGDAYPGAYALNCGGEKAELAFAWDANDAKARGATKLFFTYGDLDFLKPDIERAIPFYEGLGFPIDRQIIPGAEHCAFDAHGRAVAVFGAFLGE
jgi:hypothetical protein